MRVHHAVSQRLGLKGVQILKISWKLKCMPVYQMGIQIYDQISIVRKLSKVKVHRAFSLEFGLKRVQIGQNITKFGVHGCISNRHPNLSSNFNFGNLIKSETSPCGFSKVWLKGGIKNSEHHLIWHALLSTKWESKSMIKF